MNGLILSLVISLLTVSNAAFASFESGTKDFARGSLQTGVRAPQTAIVLLDILIRRGDRSLISEPELLELRSRLEMTSQPGFSFDPSTPVWSIYQALLAMGRKEVSLPLAEALVRQAQLISQTPRTARGGSTSIGSGG